MSIVTVDLPSIAAQPQRNDMPVNIALLYLSVLSCDYVLPSPTFYAFLTWHKTPHGLPKLMVVSMKNERSFTLGKSVDGFAFVRSAV